MRKLWRIFFHTKRTRPVLVLLCLLLAGIAEAISVATLLPVAANIAGGEAGKSSQLSQYINSFMTGLGISPTIGNLVLLVTGFMLLKAALSFAALSYAGVSAARVSIYLRQQLIAAVFDARWGFFAEQKSGKFANAISIDATRAGEAYLSSAQMLAFIVQAAGYIVLALLIDWKLTLLGLSVSLVIGMVLQRLVRITKRAGYRQRDRTAALTVLMVDLLANIKPLKSMQRHEPMLAEISQVLRKIKRAMISRELSRAGMLQGSDAFVAVFVGTGIYFATTISNVSLPELVVSAVVFFQVVTITSKIQKLLQNFVQFESAYIRMEELIQVADANREIHTGKNVPDPGKSCRFENVSFSHGKTPVITDVTFDIPAFAITVLSGPSGAGKTTIIDLLIGLNLPDKGQIFVGEAPLGHVDIRAWRKMIGYVPQELNLFHASIRENITLGEANIGDEAVLVALAQAGAGDFIASLPSGLDTDVGELGSKFSGGQRQRISLARALVIRPQVLILDEVTSALDPATEAEIVQNIAALRGDYTIIVITHRPAWTDIADCLYKVSHGKVTPAAQLQKVNAKRARTVRAK